jgi:NADH-quinone oxidoreductase subunit M
VYQMLAHGVSTGGLFLIVGMLSDRRHTRLISEYGGLKTVTPRLTAVFLLITLASIGLPTLNGFIGEFLILIGAFARNWRWAAFAGTGVILSAIYMLWMVQRAFYGPVNGEKNARLPDLSVREWCAAAPMVAVAILMGLLPTLFLEPMEPAVTRVVHRVTQSQRVNVRAVTPPSGVILAGLEAPRQTASPAVAVSEVGLR